MSNPIKLRSFSDLAATTSLKAKKRDVPDHFDFQKRLSQAEQADQFTSARVRSPDTESDSTNPKHAELSESSHLNGHHQRHHTTVDEDYHKHRDNNNSINSNYQDMKSVNHGFFSDSELENAYAKRALMDRKPLRNNDPKNHYVARQGTSSQSGCSGPLYADGRSTGNSNNRIKRMVRTSARGFLQSPTTLSKVQTLSASGKLSKADYEDDDPSTNEFKRERSGVFVSQNYIKEWKKKQEISSSLDTLNLRQDDKKAKSKNRWLTSFLKKKSGDSSADILHKNEKSDKK